MRGQFPRKPRWIWALLALLLSGAAATAIGLAVANWGSFFPDQRVKTQSTQLAVDAAGGEHVAYSEVDADGDYRAAVFYGYCPTNCAAEASWTFASVPHGAGAPEEVSLALEGTKPRILVRGRKPALTDPSLLDFPYNYLSCDSSCTNAANWADSGAVAVSDFVDPFITDSSHSYFALSNGKPRFLYRKEYTFRDPDPAPPTGLYLAYCDTSCGSAGNWQKQFVTPLNASGAEYPSLAVDAGGRPRFILAQTGSDFYDRLFYFACTDAACSTTPSGRELNPISSPKGWRLRLDADGRPRVAFRQGAVQGSPGGLRYVWCDSDCAGSGAWQSYLVPGVPQGSRDGLQPDLLVTAGARYISYHRASPAADGTKTFVAFLSTCTANCESPTGSVWAQEQVDSVAAMESEFPPPPYPGCPYTFWYGGYRGSLALGPDGTPRLGHEAVALAGRTSSSSGVEVCAETWRAARVSVLGGSGSPVASQTPTGTATNAAVSATPTTSPTSTTTPVAATPTGVATEMPASATPTALSTSPPDPDPASQRRLYLPVVLRAQRSGA